MFSIFSSSSVKATHMVSDKLKVLFAGVTFFIFNQTFGKMPAFISRRVQITYSIAQVAKCVDHRAKPYIVDVCDQTCVFRSVVFVVVCEMYDRLLLKEERNNTTGIIGNDGVGCEP